MTYVVKTLKGRGGTPDLDEEYLVAIRYDRYRTGDNNTHDSTPHIEDAFKFETLAAAEMAAVFVGGWVSTLTEQPPGTE